MPCAEAVTNPSPLYLFPSCSICAMDSREEEPSNAAVPDIYEVFSTPYTGEEIPRGVRAKQSIDRGVLVEVAHCLRIPKDQYEHHLRYSVLEHYLYVGRDGGMLLALGVGSLFNHSQRPNLNYTIDHEKLVIRYHAARPIAAHEELTITYGSSSKLWFADASMDSLESGTPRDNSDEEVRFWEAFN